MPTTYLIENKNEALTSHSGLALIGALLNNRTNLKERLNETTLENCSAPAISHADVIFSMAGLICLGKPDYDAIEPFREDDFFKNSLGLEHCPSSPTLRQRLDLANGNFDSTIKDASTVLIKNTARQITPIPTEKGPLVPLDIDVSPFDNSKTKKEGVSRTYKGYDGFAPIFGYLGREGYLVNAQLREGKQHCQHGTPDFLRETIRYSKQITTTPILLRLDSGNDSAKNVTICIDEQLDFIIKRNLRKESKEQWLDVAQQHGTAYVARPGKTAYRGSMYRQLKELAEPVRIVFDVTERTIDKKGQTLLIPEIEVDTYWTSLNDHESQVIELYHDHGTSEQFHSELKSDLGLERLPSKFFNTNTLFIIISMLSYNMLR
ncbi:MAG: IS1380 family transposase, partial [Bacteroidetes bacterium]|nr:IS1380 family transposase [Bacteroidota bacterium]